MKAAVVVTRVRGVSSAASNLHARDICCQQISTAAPTSSAAEGCQHGSRGMGQKAVDAVAVGGELVSS